MYKNQLMFVEEMKPRNGGTSYAVLALCVSRCGCVGNVEPKSEPRMHKVGDKKVNE